MAKKVETEVKEMEVKESIVEKKLAALKEFIEQQKINGLQILEINENNKVLRSNLIIEGQALPLFIVVNNSVYSYIQVHLVTVTEEKAEKCLKYLNELNERFHMLKYNISSNGNIVLTCSVPSSNDHFEPALLIALVDQVKLHLEANYSDLMKKVWDK